MPPKKKKVQATEAEDLKTEEGDAVASPAPTRKARAAKSKATQSLSAAAEEESGEEEQAEPKAASTSQSKRKAKTEKAEDLQPVTREGDADTTATPVKKKAKRQPKVAEPEEPLKMRTTTAKMLVGAHVSMAKAIGNAVTNANHIGASSFALFLKNQRKWESPAMKPEDAADFRDRMVKFGYDPKRDVLPHGSYLINLANDDKDKQQQAYSCFLDDLHRCEELGINRYNFHPGSTASSSREKGIANLTGRLNQAIKETQFVTIVVENMAGHGNIIGGPLEELADIISQIEDKSRIGVCLDTCHLFAAGHDLRTQEAYDTLMGKFDRLVGFKYLRGMHLNDSKADLGANKDLHQNIGQGYLGLEAFRCLMNDKRLEGIPLVLETPCEDLNNKVDQAIWATEIKLLEWLVGKPADDKEVVAKAKELQALGAADREKAVIAAQKKAAKASTPKKKKGKTAALSELDSD
ncbi:xylose isomerase-like protein [Protomyces lactucae-debilis]|uniref:Apurinic-apyrimidinic endonuclease 1 n=1 Tax=Protomyces lactucae-debilis TaxID=2754530 RepID=A0A1Y2FH90_PROLT|nr:xylose isomerase-like protein [Protomyces lactucae-debilis]ORY83299.1 xylose isomerase-like protein [Protomyces lactucae-debilis]